MSKFGVLFTRNFSASCRRLGTKYPKRSLLKTEPDYEYVYGISSVTAALHSKKRELKSVYIQESKEKKTTKKKDQSLLDNIMKAAEEANIRVFYKDKGQLNNISLDKPHQGVMLKASTRSMIELGCLSALTESGSYEGTIKTNKGQNTLVSKFNFQPQQNSRFPLWIALDEVQDPQNFGSILRSAHFFGVDGVIVCRKNSAPLSPAVSKVSSGAMEVMDVFSTKNLLTFLNESNENGWDVIGASSEPDADSVISVAEANDKPTILVLGNEGVGLRTNIKNACKRFTRIPNALNGQFNGSVDSLNVGVAAGILIYSFKK